MAGKVPKRWKVAKKKTKGSKYLWSLQVPGYYPLVMTKSWLLKMAIEMVDLHRKNCDFP